MVDLKNQNIKRTLISLAVVFGLANQGNIFAQTITLDHFKNNHSNSTITLLNSYLVQIGDSYENKSIMFRRPIPKVQKGIFCQAEDKIWAASNIAFRFRLGSVNYVDWMERKTQFYNQY